MHKYIKAKRHSKSLGTLTNPVIDSPKQTKFIILFNYKKVETKSIKDCRI